MAYRYLTIEEVILLHHTEVTTSRGVRDRGLLASAVARPASTAFGVDVHRGIAAKTAALLEALVMNHPFLDGNKRTGVLAALVFAELNGAPIETSDDTIVDTVYAIIDRLIDLDSLTAIVAGWMGV